jgi:hypothetical protein
VQRTHPHGRLVQLRKIEVCAAEDGPLEFGPVELGCFQVDLGECGLRQADVGGETIALSAERALRVVETRSSTADENPVLVVEPA